MTALSIDFSISSNDDDNNINNDNNNNERISTRTLTSDQRKAVLELYDQFKCKTSALQVIKSISGFQDVNERKIKRWKKQATVNCPGRPISDEFEMEVLKECERVSRLFKVKRVSTSNIYTYSLVKHCANEVLCKDFWDDKTCSFVKKWQLDKRTCNLRFTNKWILGVLRRELKKRGDATRGGDDESSNAMEDGVNEVSAVLPGGPGQESSSMNPFSNDDSQQQEPSFDSLDCCEDPLLSFLEDFIAFDDVNDDDQELDNLLVDLESLDREKMFSVSSRCYSYSSSSCKEVSHCLGDDLLDLDFDCVL